MSHVAVRNDNTFPCVSLRIGELATFSTSERSVKSVVDVRFSWLLAKASATCSAGVIGRSYSWRQDLESVDGPRHVRIGRTGAPLDSLVTLGIAPFGMKLTAQEQRRAL